MVPHTTGESSGPVCPVSHDAKKPLPVFLKTHRTTLRDLSWPIHGEIVVICHQNRWLMANGPWNGFYSSPYFSSRLLGFGMRWKRRRWGILIIFTKFQTHFEEENSNLNRGWLRRLRLGRLGVGNWQRKGSFFHQIVLKLLCDSSLPSFLSKWKEWKMSVHFGTFNTTSFDTNVHQLYLWVGVAIEEVVKKLSRTEKFFYLIQSLMCEIPKILNLTIIWKSGKGNNNDW